LSFSRARYAPSPERRLMSPRWSNASRMSILAYLTLPRASRRARALAVRCA
jgi:hypothetical protein